jgi:uncharacterized repeat protein (TIGR01451 family)
MGLHFEMNRTFLTALLVIFLLLAGLVTFQPPVIGLALPVLIYLLVGLWRGPAHIDLVAERSLSAERALTGDEITVTLTVRNKGSDLAEVLVEDLLPDGLNVVAGQARHLTALAGGGSVTWTYTISGKRGYYSLNKVRATTHDTLGLVVHQSILSTDGQLFILPPTLRLRRVSIQPRRTRVYSGTIPARQGGTGVEFFDIRDYLPGDSPRWINWRAAARHPEGLYSNQFEQERVVDVGIILDGRRATNEFGHRSIFEHSVLAAAALSDALLNSGNRVGMLFYGKQVVWTLPGYGKLQSERILHDLSRLETGDSMSFTNIFVPRHLFPARSQIVLISPLAADDFLTLAELRIRGYHMLIISPNPVAFEAAALPKNETTQLARQIVQMQRRVLLRRLRGMGIQVMDWDISIPFEQAAKRDLERRPMMTRGIQP